MGVLIRMVDHVKPHKVYESAYGTWTPGDTHEVPEDEAARMLTDFSNAFTVFCDEAFHAIGPRPRSKIIYQAQGAVGVLAMSPADLQAALDGGALDHALADLYQTETAGLRRRNILKAISARMVVK